MKTRLDRRTFLYGAGTTALLGGFVARGNAGDKHATTARASKPGSGMKLRPLSKDFISRLPEMMKLARVPGVAIGYVENGKATWTGNFGVRNAETKTPVTNDTVWQVGSLSKPVFALAVMKLVEEGKLDLDRPLADYVPGDLIKDEPRAKLITSRHALSHSTGLQNWRFQAGQNLQMSFAPGERWSYSGEGIYYLQRAVEQITGSGFEELMQSRVLGPLGMTSSSYFWRPDYENRIVTAHNNDGSVAVDYMITNSPRMQKLVDEWKKPVATWRAEDLEKAQGEVEKRFPPFPTFFAVNAAGTLFSTISDYSKFLISMFDSRFDHVFKPQVKINDAVSWGLGWGLQTQKDSMQFWHWGEGINYRTFVIGDRKSRCGLVVFTNARKGRVIWERIVMEAAGDQPLMLWL